MLFQTSLGIYIKDNSLSLAYLKASFKGVNLAAQAVFSIDKEKPVKERLDTVSDLVREFMEKNGISATDIFIGISREMAIIRFIELPMAVKENLRETLGYEMDKYVPFSTDSIYFDFQIITEDKENNRLGVALVVVRKESLYPYIEFRDRFGTGGISGIEINTTATCNYFSRKSNDPGQNDILLIDLTDKDLELNIIKERYLTYSRFLKIPGNAPDMQRLISGELKNVRDAFGPMNISFLVPESEDAQLLRSAGMELGFEEKPNDISKAGISSNLLVPAYGLALKGIQKVPVDINLLPETLRKKASRAGLYAMFILMGLLILSALAWGLGDIVRQRVTLEKVNNEIKSLNAEIEKIERVKIECKALEDQIDFLNKLGPGGFSALDVLKELSERIPENASLRRFSLDVDKVQIEGNAGSASDLISLIETCPIFKDAAFLSPISKQRDGKESFRIGFRLIDRPAS